MTTSPVDDGYHNPVEEYLETIYGLWEEGHVVIAARLAERLGRAPASVSQMLDRLEVDGLIERAGRTVTLTEVGVARAESVTRRHRLAERLLVDIIGLPWHKAHLEAGRWEHVISEDVEARLIAILDHPSTCPHGNPIPGHAQHTSPPTQSLLAGAPGEHVTIWRIGEDLEHRDGALEHLETLGMLPGHTFSIVGTGPDAVSLRDGRGAMHTLPASYASSVYVVIGATA